MLHIHTCRLNVCAHKTNINMSLCCRSSAHDYESSSHYIILLIDTLPLPAFIPYCICTHIHSRLTPLQSRSYCTKPRATSRKCSSWAIEIRPFIDPFIQWAVVEHTQNSMSSKFPSIHSWALTFYTYFLNFFHHVDYILSTSNLCSCWPLTFITIRNKKHTESLFCNCSEWCLDWCFSLG